MQHYIQSVHIKLSYFTIKLQSNPHLTYYSYNIQKDLKLNLDRALEGQLIRIGYLLKITIEIGILKVQCYKDRTRKDLTDWIISMSLVYLIGWRIGLGLNR
jgi:hypothetical protein